LFWALQVTKFSVAFSGFANATPWYILGVLLLGEAASRTGLAKRLGYLLVQRTGTSYSRLLLGIIMLIWLMSFLIPSPTALVTTPAPVALWILAVFGAERGGNLAKGLFVILTYVATVFGKMILGGGVTVLARGIIETQTGLQVLWSQWLLAFLPCALLMIVAAWLTVRWLYPVKSDVLPGGRQSLRETIQAMGPWSAEEQKTLAALLLAIGLRATDFLHQLNPAVIALGVGLLLTLPKVGVLDTQALKSVNFLLVVFVGGALSMGTVLAETEVLHLVMGRLLAWLGPLLLEAWQASVILYWSNVLYHFLLGNELTLVSASLPVLLELAEVHGYNAVAL
jgi:di/tricarboxylate transporter